MMAANLMDRIRNVGSEMPVLDRRDFDRLSKRIDKTLRVCNQPELGLPRSQPNILQVLGEFMKTLRTINSVYGVARLQELSKIPYFAAFRKDFEERLKEFAKLLNDFKIEIPIPGSTARKNTVKSIVHFSYLHHQLCSFFPNGVFKDTYKFAKVEAANFWNECFGTTVFVEWHSFMTHFSKSFNISGMMQSKKLKDEMNFSMCSYLTMFEFDLFTRLFAPWAELRGNWEALTVKHDGYLSYVTYDDVHQYLLNYTSKPGTYVFRMSCTSLGFWSVGYVRDDGVIAQTVVKDKPIVDALVEGKERKNYLYPGGQLINPDLSGLSRRHDRLQVTQELCDEYSTLGSTYQLCKICQERDKDTRLEPCGHLLCGGCVKAWLNRGEGCPFCRTHVSSTVKIVFDVPDFVTDATRKSSISSNGSGGNSASGSASVSMATSPTSSLVDAVFQEPTPAPKVYENLAAGHSVSPPKKPVVIPRKGSMQCPKPSHSRPLPRAPGSPNPDGVLQRRGSCPAGAGRALPPISGDVYDLPQADQQFLRPVDEDTIYQNGAADMSAAPVDMVETEDVYRQPTVEDEPVNNPIREESVYNQPSDTQEERDVRLLVSEGYGDASVRKALMLSSGNVNNAREILKAFTPIQ